MTDTTDQLTQLQAENARLRKAIERLENESNDHFERYKAARERLKALARYIGLVDVAVRHSIVTKWKRKSLSHALSYLEEGAASPVRFLDQEHPNDTFCSAWAVLQFWDDELDHDPKAFNLFKDKFNRGSN